MVGNADGVYLLNRFTQGNALRFRTSFILHCLSNGQKCANEKMLFFSSVGNQAYVHFGMEWKLHSTLIHGIFNCRIMCRHPIVNAAGAIEEKDFMMEE